MKESIDMVSNYGSTFTSDPRMAWTQKTVMVSGLGMLTWDLSSTDVISQAQYEDERNSSDKNANIANNE